MRHRSLSPVKEGSARPDVTYFPGVQLNFAENMLRHGAPGAALANAEALVSVSESRDDKRWTFAELADDASRVRAALEKISAEAAALPLTPDVEGDLRAELGPCHVATFCRFCGTPIENFHDFG